MPATSDRSLRAGWIISLIPLIPHCLPCSLIRDIEASITLLLTNAFEIRHLDCRKPSQYNQASLASVKITSHTTKPLSETTQQWHSKTTRSSSSGIGSSRAVRSLSTPIWRTRHSATQSLLRLSTPPGSPEVGNTLVEGDMGTSLENYTLMREQKPLRITYGS